MQRGFRSEVIIGLIVFVMFILGAIFFGGPARMERIHSLRTWQEADAPPGYPIEVSPKNPDGRVPSFDGQLVLHDAFNRFRTPTAIHFAQPLGSAQGALAYNAQSFLEMNERAGARHLGDDLNGIGGMNTDEGDPVFAAANGLVVYAGDRTGAWGKVVIIAHRLPDGRLVHSLYGHLGKIQVARGALVARGQELGTVGTANGAWLAHLHFETYVGAMTDPGPGYAQRALNRLDPTELISTYARQDPDDLSPEPLAEFEKVQQVFQLGTEKTAGEGGS